MTKDPVDSWTTLVIAILVLALVAWLVVGCAQPPQTLQMVIDGNGHVVRAEWFWLDEFQDYCRFEAVREPTSLRVHCRNGEVLTY